MKLKTTKTTTALISYALAGTLASGCGGGSSSGGSGTPHVSPPASTSVSIGGSVSGLPNGSNVVLQNNGADNLTVSANGSFTFKTSINSAAAYAVSVLTQPAGASCTVAGGTGTTSSTNITSVAITCTAITATIGGSVTGLPDGSTVVLQDNGADNLTVSASGSFTFATALAEGANYSVSVLTQPSGASCSVANATGAASSTNVTNVSVQCAQTPPAGGNVTAHRMTIGGFGSYSLLIRADGSVIAAGDMAGGAGTPISGSAFSLITGASPAVAVVADDFYETSFARHSGTNTMGWGQVFPFFPSPANVSDLGIGLSSTVDTPTAVSQLSSYSDFKAASGITLGTNADGSIWIFPGKAVLSTGVSGTTVTATPTQVTGVGAIQALMEPGSSPTDAVAFPVIDTQGNVSFVNINPISSMVSGSSVTVQSTYTVTQAGGLPPVSQVSCGDLSAVCVALGRDGTVWAWGSDNKWGQIGNGTTVGQTIPVQITALSGEHITQVAVNTSNSYALASDGTVYAWGGSDGLGQPYTQAINDLIPNQVPNLTGIVEIAARGADIIARDNQGNVWGWGLNSHGELGTGNTAKTITPTKAPGINMN